MDTLQVWGVCFSGEGVYGMASTSEMMVLYSSGELLKYKGYYVAVRGGKIIDKDKDFFTLLKRLREKYGELTDIVIEYIPEKPVELIV